MEKKFKKIKYNVIPRSNLSMLLCLVCLDIWNLLNGLVPMCPHCMKLTGKLFRSTELANVTGLKQKLLVCISM